MKMPDYVQNDAKAATALKVANPAPTPIDNKKNTIAIEKLPSQPWNVTTKLK